jgi:hypothetical protein
MKEGGHPDISFNGLFRVSCHLPIVHKSLQLLSYGIRDVKLLLTIAENNACILGAGIIALPVESSGVVHLKKELTKVFVCLCTSNEVEIVYLRKANRQTNKSMILMKYYRNDAT